MVLRVLHLVGSAVSDFLLDLSALYARDCLAGTADPQRYEFHIAYVTPDRRWRFPSDLSADAIRDAPSMELPEAIAYLIALRLDVVVPQMFCLPGMTTYRSLFDLLDIPYLGNAPDVMAVAADKMKAKAVVAAAGVPVPLAEVLRQGDRPNLEPPAVVKPVDGDNSLGVSLVRDRDHYDAAITAALAHSDRALTETYVELGREVRCGILVRDGELVCLPLEEYNVDAATRPIRNHDDKISRDGGGELNLVAKEKTKAWIVDTADPITARVWAAARKCHEALGCRDYSLFDFRVDPAGLPWFLEAGLYCSFAEKSVISVMAGAAGMPLDELFRTAIVQATRRGLSWVAGAAPSSLG